MPCSSSNGLSDGTSQSVWKWKRCIQLNPAVWPQLFQRACACPASDCGGDAAGSRSDAILKPCLSQALDRQTPSVMRSSHGCVCCLPFPMQSRNGLCHSSPKWRFSLHNSPPKISSYHVSAETVLINTVKMLRHQLKPSSGHPDCCQNLWTF